MTKPLFLAEALAAPFGLNAGTQEGEDFLRYISDVVNGPADGEQDIEWRSSARGYFSHLEAVESISSEKDKSDYVEKLAQDIDHWLRLTPGNGQVLAVKAWLRAN